jgi:hypothetical protein
MPTDLGRPYRIDWRGDPPHLLHEDSIVWYRFLDKWGFQFLHLYYDVLLGGPWLTQEEKKDPLKWMWRVNISKRADVIAELANEVWFIEVDADPGLRVLGQLLAYRSLWLEDPKILKPERLVLVSQRIDEDLFSALGRHGVSIFVIP